MGKMGFQRGYIEKICIHRLARECQGSILSHDPISLCNLSTFFIYFIGFVRFFFRDISLVVIGVLYACEIHAVCIEILAVCRSGNLEAVSELHRSRIIPMDVDPIGFHDCFVGGLSECPANLTGIDLDFPAAGRCRNVHRCIMLAVADADVEIIRDDLILLRHRQRLCPLSRLGLRQICP